MNAYFMRSEISIVMGNEGQDRIRSRFWGSGRDVEETDRQIVVKMLRIPTYKELKA